MRSRPVIAILHHECYRRVPQLHLIRPIHRHWSAAGFEVKNLYGVRDYEPADILFLHVALSVVPDEYLDFASRYPRVINGKITDIRKRSYSLNLVTRGDPYEGPVIVKTSLNAAGWSETFRDREPHYWSPFYRLYWRFCSNHGKNYPFRIQSKSDYRIYPSLKEIPAEIRDCPELVVERFLPERDGAYYCLREWCFFGDREFSSCEHSLTPIFTSGTVMPFKVIPPPPEIRAVRERLHLEYGKIDYAMHEGRPILFDVNKTMGVIDPDSNHTQHLAKILAQGIYTYFPKPEPAHEPH